MGGEVEADVVGAAGTEDMSRAECYACMVEEVLRRACEVADDAGSVMWWARQLQGGAVEPGHVGALGPAVADRREVLLEELIEQFAILVEAGQELVEPVAAVAESGAVGDDSQVA